MWMPIRKATDDDYKRLDRAAERFMKRHHIAVSDPSPNPGLWLQYTIVEGDPYLSRLWLGCVRRALKEPHAEGIYKGFVGFDH